MRYLMRVIMVVAVAVGWHVNGYSQSDFFTSLHYTSRGMGYWYAIEHGGMENLTGIPYDNLTCSNCHAESCESCHEGESPYTGDLARNLQTCLQCHSREGKIIAADSAANQLDVHFAMGMQCMDCHSSREVHGDSIEWVSMKQPGALDTKCENCHATLTESTAHTVHGERLDCKACHERQVISCSNCHFDTFTETDQKVAMSRKDWVFLMNYDDKVTSANMQSYVANENETLLMFAPQHSHSIMRDGRQCGDCHATEAVQQLQTGEFDLTWLENDILQQSMGVIPVVDGVAYNFVYHDYQEGTWSPLESAEEPLLQYAGFGEPLTGAQLASLAKPQQTEIAENFETSLHHTSRGMGYWYDMDNGGIENLTGVPYDELSCKNCHAEDCNTCHEGEDGLTGELARDQSTCLGCHSREKNLMNIDAGADQHDVHVAAGMQCMDCHTFSDVHGDGTEYVSMKEQGALNTKCEDCHETVSQSTSHEIHGDQLDCKACHIRHVLSCTNCHMPTMLEQDIKVAMPTSGWVFLMNYYGQVTSANMQTHYVSEDKTFMLFAPQNSHSVMKEGRICEDCHATETVVKVQSGELDLTWMLEGAVQQTTGVIPVVEEVSYNFAYHDYVAGAWVPVENPPDPMMHYAGFGEPLTGEQLVKLASAQIYEPEGGCDFNGDGKLGIADVVKLLLLARDNPSDPLVDWNSDGAFTWDDVVLLVQDIWNGHCPPETSALLASAGNLEQVAGLEGLSAEDIAYLEQMMARMNLTPEQEAAFHLVLYGEAGAARLPKVFSLTQNSPNPFNPATTISYSVPEGASERITLKVYDLRGRLVRTLVEGIRGAGTYSVYWDGTDESSRQVSSGVYLYRMQAGEFTQTRKMVILK